MFVLRISTSGVQRYVDVSSGNADSSDLAGFSERGQYVMAQVNGAIDYSMASIGTGTRQTEHCSHGISRRGRSLQIHLTAIAEL